MAKIYMDGKIVATGHGPQPTGLAIHQAARKAREERFLYPYAIRKSEWYREYIVSRDGVDVETFPRKTDAVAWILDRKAEENLQKKPEKDLELWQEILLAE